MLSLLRSTALHRAALRPPVISIIRASGAPLAEPRALHTSSREQQGIAVTRRSTQRPSHVCVRAPSAGCVADDLRRTNSYSSLTVARLHGVTPISVLQTHLLKYLNVIGDGIERRGTDEMHEELMEAVKEDSARDVIDVFHSCRERLSPVGRHDVFVRVLEELDGASLTRRRVHMIDLIAEDLGPYALSREQLNELVQFYAERERNVEKAMQYLLYDPAASNGRSYFSVLYLCVVKKRERTMTLILEVMRSHGVLITDGKDILRRRSQLYPLQDTLLPLIASSIKLVPDKKLIADLLEGNLVQFAAMVAANLNSYTMAHADEPIYSLENPVFSSISLTDAMAENKNLQTRVLEELYGRAREECSLALGFDVFEDMFKHGIYPPAVLLARFWRAFQTLDNLRKMEDMLSRHPEMLSMCVSEHYASEGNANQVVVEFVERLKDRAGFLTREQEERMSDVQRDNLTERIVDGSPDADQCYALLLSGTSHVQPRVFRKMIERTIQGSRPTEERGARAFRILVEMYQRGYRPPSRAACKVVVRYLLFEVNTPASWKQAASVLSYMDDNGLHYDSAWLQELRMRARRAGVDLDNLPTYFLGRSSFFLRGMFQGSERSSFSRNDAASIARADAAAAALAAAEAVAAGSRSAALNVEPDVDVDEIDAYKDEDEVEAEDVDDDFIDDDLDEDSSERQEDADADEDEDFGIKDALAAQNVL